MVKRVQGHSLSVSFLVFLVELVQMGAMACSARNPLADAYPDWEIDNTPWEVPLPDCFTADGVDGIDGIGGCDAFIDAIDGIWDQLEYTTDFDVTDQEYVPDIPEVDGGIPIRSCGVTVNYRPSSPSVRVYIAGEFNGWNPSSDQLTDPDGDGTLSIELDLEPGEYAYKFVLGGTEWIRDPVNPWTKYHCTAGNCELNSNLRVPDCDKPQLVMLSYEALPTGTISGRVQYVDSRTASGPAPSSFRVLRNGIPAPFELDVSTGLVTFSWTSLPPGKHMTRIEASSNDGTAADPLYLPGWIEAKPWDWRDAIIYFAFTDRFLDGDPSNNRPIGVERQSDYQGGDFAGIKRKIEDGYFRSMGVNVLWISPPYENPETRGIGHDGHYYSGYHGYWPVDPLAAETTFGGDGDLEEMLDAAHSAGIRVLLDAVLNHVHIEHPYWSAHRPDGWFHGTGNCICGQGTCDWDRHRIDCWFTSYLPDIDYRNHNALVTMVNDTLEWVFVTGFDGMRVDAVKHFEHIVGQRLALTLSETFEITGQRFYMVGETFTGGYSGGCWGGPDLIMQFVNPIELDGQFDFPLFWVILDVFARESADFSWLDRAVRGLEACYGTYPIMSAFLGNHDVPRFISIANGDNMNNPWGNPPPTPSSPLPYQKLRLAFTFLLTHTAVPLIYYGDEIGLPGAGDPDNRRLMKFTGLTANEQLVLDRVRLAGRARAEQVALRRGVRRTLHVDSNFYVYVRGTGSEAVIVALNRNPFEVTSPPIALPADLGITSGTTFTDLVSSRTFQVSGAFITIRVGAKDGAILVQ